MNSTNFAISKGLWLMQVVNIKNWVKSSFHQLKIHILSMKTSKFKQQWFKNKNKNIMCTCRKSHYIEYSVQLVMVVKLLVLMSSCRQWNIGSDVSSSANIHPIAQISLKQKQTKKKEKRKKKKKGKRKRKEENKVVLSKENASLSWQGVFSFFFSNKSY